MLTLLKDSVRPLYHFATDSEYREYCRLFSRFSSHPRYRRTDIRFQKYLFTVADTASFIHQFKEIFLDQVYNFLAGKKNPVIYDCGANIGLSCLYFKKKYPECIIKAFEADPEIFKLLRYNLEKNLDMKDVTLFNQAIWIDGNGVEFTSDGADGGSVIQGAKDGKINIASVRLKDLLQNEQIDFLKIDIEGAEEDVLLDCDGSFHKVERIFFEYHSFRNRPQRLDQLLRVMSNNGFRYFIQPLHSRKAPFTHTAENEVMDLQLNIYCYRSI